MLCSTWTLCLRGCRAIAERTGNDFNYNRQWMYIIQNGPDILAQAYTRSMNNMLKRWVSSQCRVAVQRKRNLCRVAVKRKGELCRVAVKRKEKLCRVAVERKGKLCRVAVIKKGKLCRVAMKKKEKL